jgi:hypothetical protein
MIATRIQYLQLSRVAIAFCVAFTIALVNARTSLATEPDPQEAAHSPSYLGFDRNEYPGDDVLSSLRATFAFTGYWLNNPPGASNNSWTGKRNVLLSHGFGFLVLFNGRLDKEIRAVADPAALGRADAEKAAKSAVREGFPANTIIFLDVEEGGRMLPEQKAYIYAWADGIKGAGFRSGVYCSGIPAKEDTRHTVITAEDLKQNAAGRDLAFWVANDACPPSPGCAVSPQPPAVGMSRIPFADVWQYAQSPRRALLTRSCRVPYAPDGNCYAPGEKLNRLFLDLNAASAPDPSHGGTR